MSPANLRLPTTGRLPRGSAYPHACLMVGNNLVRDILPAQQAGMVTYLAEDWITNPDPEIQPDRRGTLGQLIDWIEDAAG